MWVRNHLANPVVRALGHSRAHQLLGRHLVLLSYCGRRTGRRHEIPVMTAAAGEDLVVVAADPEAKTWWRNFGVEPTDVLICVNGRDEPRTARRFAPGEPGYSEALTAYRRTFPRVPATSGEPVVVLAPRAH
ncbi:nitroreductase/quinone reductase family protein [Modestobacter sp. VKM Ac-2979]|uniref:nitroreductase/quinone reductase family protein n=1 Tax=unclassified Modestobacter TaxID=2643866 RepID=UPI0022AB9E16|nr:MULTISPECIES: nitroreductase/quinone reductase family protein [unclassified Modestobacter]MCZ2812040.1 nitroreductase/quinone reductase family protein [Modestobacter sp. VKM Ac-2979]MCZ2843764.1 nitroreductase/quinone reductase family protein [Modestobacter sp. VKM Ac-2980]